MKKLRIIYFMFFFMLFNISIGQAYEFDKIVKFTFSGTYTQNHEGTSLFNSNDYSYYMQIYPRNDSIISRIIDTEENVIHYFNINKSDSLEFIETLNFKKFEKKKKYTVEFSDLKSEKDPKEITFNILNKRKRRKAKFKMNIKETDQNFLPIFKLSAFEVVFAEIDLPFNFIVLKAKGRNVSGNKIEYELISIEDINTTITLP